MAIFHVVLRHFPFVGFHLLFQEINSEPFLQERVSFVFFVSQNAIDCRLAPFLFARGRRYARRLQFSAYPGSGLTLQIKPVDPAHNLRFLFVDHGQAVRAFVIAEKTLVRHAHLAVRKALALSPRHVFGNAAALLLRQ